MWVAYRPESFSVKSFQTGVLLADSNKRCSAYSENMRGLPENFRKIGSTIAANTFDNTTVWPLYKWGKDIVGPLTPAQGNYKYAIAAVEYFSKWIEVKPVTNITAATITKFFWQNIVCQFAVPR